MSEKENQSVTEPVTNSVQTDDPTNSMPSDFKSDFFKHKQRMKEAEQRAREAEERLREIELAEEEKKGNYAKVIEDLKEKVKKQDQVLKQKDFTYAKGNVEAALKQEAIKNGCTNVNAFIKLLGQEKLDSISLDENFIPSQEDIEMVIKDAAQEYESLALFGRKVNVTDRAPNNKPINMPPKTYKQMSKEEIERKLMNEY